jgi:hypothetical protein
MDFLPLPLLLSIILYPRLPLPLLLLLLLLRLAAPTSEPNFVSNGRVSACLSVVSSDDRSSTASNASLGSFVSAPARNEPYQNPDEDEEDDDDDDDVGGTGTSNAVPVAGRCAGGCRVGDAGFDADADRLVVPSYNGFPAVHDVSFSSSRRSAMVAN